MYVGPLRQGDLDNAGHELSRLSQAGAALIASTDFTHYGRLYRYEPFPLDEHTPGRLRRLDFRLIGSVTALDLEGFYDVLRQTESNMCGVWPVSLLMHTLRTLGTPVMHQILDYETSGDRTGSYASSVSYAAISFSRPQPSQWREGEEFVS
jgi:AmmeMemoRadiSam system protein B